MLEESAQQNTLCQNGTVFVNLTPPRRSDISLHKIPVNCEKTEESLSMDVQDCAEASISEDGGEQEYLKEPQPTVIQERYIGRVIKARTDLNVKEMLTSEGTDENNSDSSREGSGSSTYPVIHFPDTVTNSLDPNDNEAAMENIEADIFVSICNVAN